MPRATKSSASEKQPSKSSRARQPAVRGIAELRALRISDAARLLRDVQKKLPVLKLIAWGPEVRKRFFARGARELPRPEYSEFDPRQALDLVREARTLCRRDAAIEDWLRRSAGAAENTALMLSKAGTAAFSRRAQKLYGSPSDNFPGTAVTPIDLARRLVRTNRRVRRNMPDPPQPNLTAQDVAKAVRSAVKAHFGNPRSRSHRR